MITAFLLDWLLGDPPQWPHPVRFMGRIIGTMEQRWNHGSAWRRRWLGALLSLGLIAACWSVTAGLIALADRLHPAAGWLVAVLLGYTTLAGRSLFDHGRAVSKPLKRGDIEAARRAVGRIVARDSDDLSAEQVSMAAIESLAENGSDGVIAPLFYLIIGGAPLAMAFKAASTLDSVIGHRSDRLKDFGVFTARLEDVLSFIPARFTAVLIVFSAWLTGRDAGSAWRIMARDGHAGYSPNSPVPESAMAGALGVRLRGPLRYSGGVRLFPWVGDRRHTAMAEDVETANRMVVLASVAALIWGVLLRGVV